MVAGYSRFEVELKLLWPKGHYSITKLLFSSFPTNKLSLLITGILASRRGVMMIYRSSIGEVYVSSKLSENKQTCQSATASKKIWGYGYTINGVTKCYDISDTNDATRACENALRKAGYL